MKKLTLLLAVALVYIACDKDSDDKVDENQHNIVFSGITETDQNNQPIGEVDTNDWKLMLNG